jgi:hypothetical protein
MMNAILNYKKLSFLRKNWKKMFHDLGTRGTLQQVTTHFSAESRSPANSGAKKLADRALPILMPGRVNLTVGT